MWQNKLYQEQVIFSSENIKKFEITKNLKHLRIKNEKTWQLFFKGNKAQQTKMFNKSWFAAEWVIGNNFLERWHLCDRLIHLHGLHVALLLKTHQ